MTGELSDASGGGVIWICGLAGVGKTTLALEVTRLMAEVHASVVRIDGDEFRRAFMSSAGYEPEDRINVARTISRHAWALAQQGSLCVVATISLFTEIHDGNRACERAYQLPLIQSLLSAPGSMLQERRAALMRSTTPIVGTHIKAELPTAPEHTFFNDGRIDALLAEAVPLRAAWLARQATSTHRAT